MIHFSFPFSSLHVVTDGGTKSQLWPQHSSLPCAVLSIKMITEQRSKTTTPQPPANYFLYKLLWSQFLVTAIFPNNSKLFMYTTLRRDKSHNVNSNLQVHWQCIYPQILISRHSSLWDYQDMSISEK